MEITKVTVVRWGIVPQKDWIEILRDIPVGGYVRSLPYSTPPNTPSIVLPSDNNALTWMRFDLCRCEDKTFIWKRVA